MLWIHLMVSSCTVQVDMEQFDMWLIPINVDNMHWILLVCLCMCYN